MKKLTLAAISCLVLTLISINFFEIKTGAQSENRLQFEREKNNRLSREILLETFEKLIETANLNGKIRVIVGLDVPFVPEGYLAENEKQLQQDSIQAAQDELLGALENSFVENVVRFEIIPAVVMEVDAAALARMKQMSKISSITEDKPGEFSLVQSTALINAPQAWQAGFAGQNQTVAILDSGFDSNHPLLAGKIVSEACFSASGNLGGQNYVSVCPGGIQQTAGPGTAAALPAGVVGREHGTHVAGIAAGRSSSLSGVARDANIIAVQVSSATNCNGGVCAQPLISNWMLGLQYIFSLRNNYNIAAVNLSLGFPLNSAGYCDTAFSEAVQAKQLIQSLESAGIATIVASGNESQLNGIGFPACISNAVSVGSVDDSNFDPNTGLPRVSSFSNSAPILDLLAPGGNITSSVPGGQIQTISGTSMAAPHVAGAWAILKQRAPNASVAQILNALTATGQAIADHRGNGIVRPLIKINSALQALGGGTNPCQQVVQIAVGQTANGTLSSTDCRDSDGYYYDFYVFNGMQGQQISISMNSTVVDSYLFLSSNNQTLAQDNNGGGGLNARIPAGTGAFTLPATGSYVIAATTNVTNQLGAYTLSLNAAANCTYSLSASGQNFAAAGGGGAFIINTQSGCQWSASTSANWISITGGAGSGTGNVTFSVAANSGAARTATITAGGQTFTVNQAGATTQTRRAAFDFDGDGAADLSVFRPANGAWYVFRSSNNSFFGFVFGQNGDLIAPADYDGDGKTDIAVFRSGAWYRINSSTNQFVAVQFGQAGDVPVPGDFDGDTKADIAVFRPANGAWYRINSSNGQFLAAQFGSNGDKPQIGDFDADGKTDLAVFRPSNGAWYILRSQTNSFSAQQFGQNGDVPTVADFDGDGRADVGVYRPANGTWYRTNSSTNQFFSQQFGVFEDRPVAADFDADGKADLAVFRPSGGAWYIQRSTLGFIGRQFGANGDVATPAAFGR